MTPAVELPRAQQRSTCNACDSEIAVGEMIFPMEQPRSEARTRAGLRWLHYACACKLGDSECVPPPVPPCKHMARSGTCHFGEQCFFLHSPSLAEAALARLEARRANPNAKVANRGEGRRNRVKNDSRASVFRRWLLETYGVKELGQGSGVLDIAGGKGELAWELLNLEGVGSVVLEPRPLDFSSFLKKFSYGLYWRNPIFRRQLQLPCDAERPTASPLHLRLLLEPEVLEWACCEQPNEEVFQAWQDKAKALRWTRQGLHEEDDGDVEEEESEEVAGDGQAVPSALQAASLLRGCSIVAALHPDQAAEHAVDLALRLRKPFAVVPCCVYSRQFPRRRLPGGDHVRSYAQLLDYLQAKDPRIRRECLDFEGKCAVLFMTWEDVLTA